MADEDGGSDARMAYLRSRVGTAFQHLKPDKIDKGFNDEGSQEAITDFLESREVRTLVFDASCSASIGLPKRTGSAKGKTIVFLKLEADKLSMDTLKSSVTMSDVSGVPLEHLERVIQEVYLPLLSNPANQEGWGEVASKEILDRLHGFLANVSITVGSTKGKTCLPLPPEQPNASLDTKDRIHLLEGAVITWTKQVKAVLKLDPEGLLKQGLHPTPDMEIQFWKSKADNLNAIFDQLQSSRIRRVLQFLDSAKSTYCTPFARLCKEVFAARGEANDNVKYLRTLESWFAKLNEPPSFESLVDLFKPMMHILLLIWKNSKFYNTPARLVVLMREMCNALINQARAFISGKQLFQLIEDEEATEAVNKLKLTLRVCGAFKTTYFDYKATANAECPANPWRIQNNALFMRLDSFLERVHDILDLTQTIMQFSRLARIEVGGTKGKTLTNSVQQIHGDFETAVSAFKEVPYDIMDVGVKEFDDDFYEFRCKIKNLERRLASVLTQGFDDCATIYGRFKLLDSFDGLLERPIIQDELERKHIALVQAYGQDLKRVQELFLTERDAPPISWNLPPIAGALTWCRGLKERITEPMVKLRQLNRTIMSREEAKEVAKVYSTIISSLEDYEHQKIEEWGSDVERSSQAKLKLPLLAYQKEMENLLSVNFDPALVKLLREVKYFLLLGLEVPTSALEIYQKAEVYRRQTGNLDLIVNMYNRMVTELLPVESPLMTSHMTKIDATLQTGIKDMNWKSTAIDSFITDSQEAVKKAYNVLFSVKDNLKEIQAILEQWAATPLLSRKPKPVTPAEFETAHKALVTQRFQEIKQGGMTIEKKLQGSHATMKVSKAHPNWRAYVDFTNSIVVMGLSRLVIRSLQYLADQLDPEIISQEGLRPMLLIRLDLVGGQVRFIPDVEENGGDGSIWGIVNNWIDRFYQVATLFKRLDDPEGRYVKEMVDDMYVQMLLATVNERLADTEDACVEFKKTYEKYEYLWSTDLKEMFEEFKEDAIIPNETGGTTPDLKKYGDKITSLKKVQAEINDLKTPNDLGWLRVSSDPIKQALATCVTKWIFCFTDYLQQYVLGQLTDLNDTISRVSEGLQETVSAEDESKEPLKRVMGHIRDVKKTMDERRQMFGPLRETTALLRTHGVGLETHKIAEDQTVMDFLETAPLKWDATVNSTFKKKEEIFPLQTAEMDNIKESVEGFFLSMREFRNRFRKTAPFSFSGPAAEAYSSLDSFQAELGQMEDKSKSLNEVEDLFELPVSKYNETTDSSHELNLLKQLWDFKELVRFSYDDWQTALWNDVDTEALEDKNKKLAGQLKKMGDLNQIVKGWQVYRDLEKEVKNMSVALPLVNDLHSPAMRPRHWKEIARVCQCKALDPNDAKFCLEDLLSLNLHTFVDDLLEIVETAAKELKIERKMEGIEGVWNTLDLDYVPHKDSDVVVVRPSDEVVEFLEEHQMELQTIIGMGKFVDYFRDRVMTWQKNLGTVESVLREWVSVTKAWASLESIFLASADIRAQLPDDTKRFEGIDQEFKDLMKSAVETPNAVVSCTSDGREEKLKEMTRNLELCQKSLNEYLDMKKKIFPRFYFVSNVALLDMLSNSNNPAKILPYLGDCFDSLQMLKMEPPVKEGEPATVASSMSAKDGEIVNFHTPFVIKGPVEDWLNDLEEKQMNTMSLILESAIETAVNWDVEKPRHEWLRDYPAQIVLTACLVYWTEETQAALDELEAGQEDSVKKYIGVCNERLAALIKLVLGKLDPDLRAKIISLITIDVHSRDVVQALIDGKADGPLSFLWQQQLRFYWAAEQRDVDINITDYKGQYFYEWVGNSGRLVITPLTDRCYITLTMALRLMLGGAPAGPAGTGKTETVKDLARACALPCYVFNCSPQMNYQTLGNIFKGLSQTGAWGCFDEFNRISIEVLSVVATQVKQVLDAIVKYANPANREEKYASLPAGRPNATIGRFELGGDLVTLKPTNGIFITMNPGYAGRTELPENIKALFRSCAMIRPDLALICENMLMSEGFGNARLLSVKFTTLYRLCSELLSPQHHYDWGLRAVKSVLRVAGGLKRADPDIEEDGVLMRALRDFNTPKMPSADLPIFGRLIQDMFPFHHHLATKFDEALQKLAQEACAEYKLQPDTGFVHKVVQLQELLDVRHSVMLLGPAGCAKSSIWRVLSHTKNIGAVKKPCVTEVVNPKAVPLPELYGYMTLAKEWKDGVVSIIMRGMSKNYKELGFHEYQTDKWIVFDGDIDTLWIESMNTVMDDNKTLTLVSNERIPLSRAMRLLFEISSVDNASPATVSRAGMLYINDTDVGWRPAVESWLQETVEDESIKSHLPSLFDKYMDPLWEQVRKFTMCTPLNLFNIVQTVCRLCEAYLPTAGPGAPTDFVDALFAQAVMWAFGGPIVADKNGDHRRNFHDVFTAMVGAIKYPKENKEDICFDYFFNPRSGNLEHWKTLVPDYVPVPIGAGVGESLFSSLLVPTVDTVRLTNLLENLHKNNHPVMFIGVAGTGKTAVVKDFLKRLDPDQHVTDIINMNYYMDCVDLQLALEGPIDKRSGKIFGPPTGKHMTYYVDDVNLPWIEDYGTQNSLSLMRQVIDHGFVFDRADLSLRKELVDLRFVGTMNPTAGSFTVSKRLQRFFSTFAITMPSTADLGTIYSSILNGHLSTFAPEVQDVGKKAINAALSLHTKITAKFLPSAIRFVYNWNMRELARVVENLTLTQSQYYPDAKKFSRLYAHECNRVFRDRLVNEGDMAIYDAMLAANVKEFLGDPAQILQEPLLYTSFAAQPSPSETAYLPLPGTEAGLEMLSKTLADRLEDYNSENTIMDLVLFQDAMEHVCRICRIIFNPAGNAMLVGVGGSGKQSLSRLAASINGFEVKQLAVTARFTVLDLKESLKEMYMLAGVKGQGMVFLMTDTQITNERFLVFVNEMLSSGWIKGIFEKDEMENVFSSLRNEAKQAGVPDSADSMMEFFISRILRNLHVVLCFSPVGESFRVRARRFPGLINCTSIDWFHAWPRSALESVAARFIEEVELGTDEVRDAVAKHMAQVHVGVTDISVTFKQQTRRANYVTPKSFLELIAFYKHLLGEKRGQVGKQIHRLDVGLSILRKTQGDVAELQVDLEHTMVKVAEKKTNTEKLLKDMGAERAVAEEQQAIAEVEAEKAAAASAAAAKIEAEASAELAEAQPAMEAAADAVNCLSKASLTELKSMSKPPDGVDKVTACCLMMIDGEFKNHAWDRAKKMMGKIDQFIDALKTYRGEDITEQLIDRLTPFVKDPLFTQEKMASKSSAAANLCAWVVNIYKYNRIYVKVKPLMDALQEAQANKAAAQEQLRQVQEKVAEVEARLKQLQDKLKEATDEKLAVEREAQACTDRLGLAERLVNGLASENTRWGDEIQKLRDNENTLVGDVLLASAFVSYIGAFDHTYRVKLWQDTWLPDLRERGVPMSEVVDPLIMLTDDGHTTKMLSDGLPADRISIENGSIVSACKRWPLLIDPQLQGIKWLRQREENRGEGVVCKVIQLTQNNWLRHVTNAIQQGHTIIIENVGEEIDATLDPVLSRAVYKKGRTFFLQVGGEEVEYDPKFRLYLQSKLTNPHYKPEIQAQCTLVNFIATEAGLADQLLARVVKEEKFELEQKKTELQEAFNRYQIQLMELEDQLLERLSNAPDDILSDVPLIEGLEATKAAAVEIEEAVTAGRKTEAEINIARQVYVPVSVEGAMLYFMITQLDVIQHMYQYSLDAFLIYFYKAIREAPPSEEDKVRVGHLRDTLRFVIYTWVSRGLFEKDKLILLGQLTFQLIQRGMLELEVEPDHFRYLITGPKKLGGEANPLSWLPTPAWNGVLALADLEEFAKLPSDLIEAPTRFMEWFNHVTPETEKLPLDWARLDKEPFKKLMVLRAMRPDRMNVALTRFVSNVLPAGRMFVDCDSTSSSLDILAASVKDSLPVSPLFFILSPGADVVGDVEALAARLGYEKGVSYHNVAMGQGQDVIAMDALEMGHKQGHWVLLNNVHLMPVWLIELEKKLDAFAQEGSHERFRVLLTGEPSNAIPIGILNRSIKLTNEPPSGLKANLNRAFCSFSPEYINEVEPKTRAILFGLCFFHAVLIERKKFGPIGYNIMYPFSLGDLRDSSVCLSNYMENAGSKIPWEDLRYIFGQIMYGGHIVNDFDRLLCVTYLDHFLRDELLDEHELFPFVEGEKTSFRSPNPTEYTKYLEHIDKELVGDTPLAFGLHPNAEIGFRTAQSNGTFKTLQDLQPRDSGEGENSSTPEQVAEGLMTDILDRFGDTRYELDELGAGEEKGPFQNVLTLECEQMNRLLVEVHRSLTELGMGFLGELTVSDAMDALMTSLFMGRVPASWARLAWPSLRNLSLWLHDWSLRITQLSDWAANPLEIPKVTWLSGMINPQSFLTAIAQQTAQRQSLELDKLVIQTDVTKKSVGDVDAASRDGAFVCGFSVEGCRWDKSVSMLDRSRPREMTCPMPVINCRATPADKVEHKGYYNCPVYKTQNRGADYVFMAQLRTKVPSARWIMSGVAMVLDVVA